MFFVSELIFSGCSLWQPMLFAGSIVIMINNNRPACIAEFMWTPLKTSS